jgi:hypothetical protein
VVCQPSHLTSNGTKEKKNMSISAVIPIAAQDEEWRGLLPIMGDVPEVDEIILSLSDQLAPSKLRDFEQARGIDPRIRLVQGPQGRAWQLNRALAIARSEWIWVLHADSRFGTEVRGCLAKRMPSHLHYFDLAFRAPCSQLLKLNAWAVRWRSQLLGLPFGDQGFLFESKRAEELGGFPEGLAYGEDHVFVWRWRQRGWPLRRLPASVETSARRYTQQGWSHTTLRHLFLTVRQAYPEFCSYLKAVRRRR